MRDPGGALAVWDYGMAALRRIDGVWKTTISISAGGCMTLVVDVEDVLDPPEG